MANRGIGQEVIEVTAHKAGAPAVVFGAQGKLRASGPFLDLLAEFRKALGSTDRLVIVGYSFRDDHINETIRKWIRGSTTRGIVVLDPETPPPQTGPTPAFSTWLFDALSPNVRGRQGPTRLAHVRSKATADSLAEALRTDPLSANTPGSA